MSTVLDKIVATKREEVAARRSATPIEALRETAAAQAPARGFIAALRNTVATGKPAVIAEAKKASPSEGVIRADFDPAAIAKGYEAAGATCLSVLTDETYFGGKDADLVAARSAVSLPVIRKDFIIDEYQLAEARAMGADCVLLIVACLDIMRLTVLNQAARGLGLDVLIEVHDEAELQAALSQQPSLIGINNRNLKTLSTDLRTTHKLLPSVPDDVLVVTESGIATQADVGAMREAGVHAFLVGTSFMRQPDPGAELSKLFF